MKTIITYSIGDSPLVGCLSVLITVQVTKGRPSLVKIKCKKKNLFCDVKEKQFIQNEVLLLHYGYIPCT